MRISDWSDVCSSDLLPDLFQEKGNVGMALAVFPDLEVEGAGADLAVFGRGRVVAQQRVVHRMVDRVDAEAVHAAVQPEAYDVEHALLHLRMMQVQLRLFPQELVHVILAAPRELGRASGRERECQYVYISGVAGSLKKKKKK